MHAADGAPLYRQHCAACHQEDGAGVPGAFPPLAGNPALSDAAHVGSVIADGLSGPIEVGGQSYHGTMPAFAGQLSESDLQALVDYVRTAWGNDVALSGGASSGAGAGSGAGGEAPAGTPQTGTAQTGTAQAGPAPANGAAAAAPGDGAASPSAGNAAAGSALFSGRTRFKNRGTPCAACHSVAGADPLGGGSMGRDLTTAYDRLGGSAGLTGVLQSISFPVMRHAFAGRPLTQREVADLVAYLRQAADTAKAEGTAGRDPGRFGFNWLWLIAILGAGLLYALLLIWWPRQRESLAERLRRTGRSWRR